jgi:L-ascorbate metabolism protein UlaG (beta-lactamase superfamily)
MEIQYYGATAIKIGTKKTQAVIDPNPEVAKLKIDLKKANFILASTDKNLPSNADELFVINSPGEYEFEDTSVKGIAAQPFEGSAGDKTATIYSVSTADTRVLVTGNINEKLTEDQLEKIGMVDVLVVPVGGNGISTDAIGAATLVRSIEPKVVIPVFYSEDGVKYEVAPASLEAFTKELGAPVSDSVDKYKIKNLPEQLTVQPLKVS